MDLKPCEIGLSSGCPIALVSRISKHEFVLRAVLGMVLQFGPLGPNIRGPVQSYGVFVSLPIVSGV
jgi:hypothetical protein